MTQPPYGDSQLPPPPPSAYPPPPGAGSPYAYGPAYPPAPAAPDHTLRIVLLVVGGVVVVVGGLIVWFIMTLAHGAENIENYFDTDYPGSESSPLTVNEGEAFSIRGFSYAEGWSLDAGGSESVVSGLEATNERGDRDTSRADLQVTLLDGTTIVEQLDCYSDVTISYGRSAVLECSSPGDTIPAYDSIEVNATALFP